MTEGVHGPNSPQIDIWGTPPSWLRVVLIMTRLQWLAEQPPHDWGGVCVTWQGWEREKALAFFIKSTMPNRTKQRRLCRKRSECGTMSKMGANVGQKEHVALVMLCLFTHNRHGDAHGYCFDYFGKRFLHMWQFHIHLSCQHVPNVFPTCSQHVPKRHSQAFWTRAQHVLTRSQHNHIR